MNYRKPRAFKLTSSETRELAEPFGLVYAMTKYVVIKNSRTLTITPGYEWDGNTGFFDFKSTMRASLVHDALYQVMRTTDTKTSRKAADLEFYRIMIECGTFPPLAGAMYIAVRLFGGFFL